MQFPESLQFGRRPQLFFTQIEETAVVRAELADNLKIGLAKRRVLDHQQVESGIDGEPWQAKTGAEADEDQEQGAHQRMIGPQAQKTLPETDGFASHGFVRNPAKIAAGT